MSHLKVCHFCCIVIKRMAELSFTICFMLSNLLFFSNQDKKIDVSCEFICGFEILNPGKQKTTRCSKKTNLDSISRTQWIFHFEVQRGTCVHTV